MPNDNVNSNFLKKACQAAEVGDIQQVAKALSSTRILPCGIDVPLLPSSSESEEILRQLHSLNPNPDFNPVYAFRALMMISPCYETPWKANLEFIKRLQKESDWQDKNQNAILSGIAESHSFFQQALSLWWRFEVKEVKINSIADNKTLTPREWLVSIALLVIHSLRAETPALRVSENRIWMSSLDVVTTILSLLQELEGSSSGTRTVILDEIFQPSISSTRLLPLMNLAIDLHGHLRDVDWDNLYICVEEAMNTNSLNSVDLPGIARSIISNSEIQPKWRQLLLQLLHSASSDCGTYSTVEAVIQLCLSSFSTRILYDWYSIQPSDPIPKWIIANYYLSIFQAVRQTSTEIVSHILKVTFKDKEKAFDVADLCVRSLTKLCLPFFSCSPQKVSPSSFQLMFVDVKYEGGGKFSRRSTPVEDFEMILLIQSLNLGTMNPNENNRQRLSATERAQTWIYAAKLMLLKPDILSKTAAILLIVVIFCEVPVSQSTLLRFIVDDLNSSDDINCTLLTIILKSLKNENDFEILRPLTGFLSSRVQSFEIFRTLTSVFVQIDFGREVVIDLSQKLLNQETTPWWSTMECRRSSQKKDIIQSALYGLCALLENWDEIGVRAWIILSDFLVMGKPSLPLVLRSWLYEELSRMIKQKRLSASVSCHLLRASLLRMLMYFSWSDTELKFIPQRAMASFTGFHDEVVKDNLTALFALAIDIAQMLAHSLEKHYDKLESFRVMLQKVVLGYNIAQFRLEGTNICFYYGLISSLLASSYNLIQGKVSGNKNDHQIVTLSPSVDEIVNIITSEEKKACSHFSTDSDIDMPQWLRSVSDQRPFNLDEFNPNQASWSICNALPKLINQPFFPLKTTEHRELASSIAMVIHTQKKVGSYFQGANEQTKHAMGIETKSIPVLLSALERNFKPCPKEVGLILTALECVCDDFSVKCDAILPHEVDINDFLAHLGAMVQVHRHVTSTNPSNKVLSITGNFISGSERHSNESFCDNDIHSCEETETWMMGFRFEVLQCILKCLNLLTQPITDVTAIQNLYLTFSKRLVVDEVDTFSFMAKTVEYLAQDMMDSVALDHGGKNSKIYILLLEVMHVLCKLVNLTPDQFPEESLIFSSVNNSCQIMNDILCTFPLDETVFRKTLEIAIIELPSICRNLLYLNSTLESKAYNIVSDNMSNLARSLFIGIEKGNASNDINYHQPSNSRFLTQGNKEDGMDDSSAKNTGIPIEILIPKSFDRVSTANKKLDVIISSETSWNNALNVVLISIYRFESEASSLVINLQAFPSSANDNSFHEYMLWRIKCHSSCLDITCRFVKIFACHGIDQNDNVFNISLVSKIKVLTILEKMLMLKAKVLRHFRTTFQQGSESSLKSFPEIAAIIIAWNVSEPSNVFDGIHRWFEGEVMLHSRTTSFTSKEKNMENKKTKILHRIKELQYILQKFDSSLSLWTKSTMDQDRERINRFVILEEEINCILRRSSLSDAKRIQGIFSFSRGVTSVLSSIHRSKINSLDGKLSNVVDEKKFQQDDRETKCRKRDQSLETQIRSERKRRIPRSRNRVIDVYQQLDREEVYYDEDFDDDAYADLEDFLVEG